MKRILARLAFGLVLAIVIVLIAWVWSGLFGHEDQRIDPRALETLITERAEKQLDGGSTVKTSCVQESDEWHFVCLLEMTGGEYDGESLTVKATCGSENDGTCVWRQE